MDEEKKADKTISINLMQDDSEIIPYDSAEIPIYIRTGWLSMYTNMRSLCHWHEDIEFVRIHEGQMGYWINGDRILLREGDCLAVNSRQMHYGYSYQGENCCFTCIILHPNLLPGNQTIYNRFVKPILQNSAFEYLQYSAQDDKTVAIRQCLDLILDLQKEHLPAYQLKIAGVMGFLFGEMNRHPFLDTLIQKKKKHPDITVRQNMIAYIYEHYPEKIGLTDIADAGNVCRNKCCQIFKKYMHQSPIEFLNHYRLEVSRNLLENKNQSVLEIAQSCGFNHSSYYSKLFYEAYRCTPTEYRKRS